MHYTGSSHGLIAPGVSRDHRFETAESCQVSRKSLTESVLFLLKPVLSLCAVHNGCTYEVSFVLAVYDDPNKCSGSAVKLGKRGFQLPVLEGANYVRVQTLKDPAI